MAHFLSPCFSAITFKIISFFWLLCKVLKGVKGVGMYWISIWSICINHRTYNKSYMVTYNTFCNWRCHKTELQMPIMKLKQHIIYILTGSLITVCQVAVKWFESYLSPLLFSIYSEIPFLCPKMNSLTNISFSICFYVSERFQKTARVSKDNCMQEWGCLTSAISVNLLDTLLHSRVFW